MPQQSTMRNRPDTATTVCPRNRVAGDLLHRLPGAVGGDFLGESPCQG
jgi:hypothetical protein